MKTYTKSELKQILKAHQEWLNGDGGSRASLSRASLSRANLSGADLSRADLSGANLSWANLSRANLSRANLSRADLSRAENVPDNAIYQNTILPEGNLIGYKKLENGVVCKVSIPKKAKRVGGVAGRKCRAEYVIVLEGEGLSSHDNKTNYKVGKKIKPDEFDDNPFIECTNGIHFFITRQEAEDY